MTRRGLYFTQGGFWFRNNPYFNKGIKRRVGVKYTIGFVFLYQLLSLQLMGSVLPTTLKKLKKKTFSKQEGTQGHSVLPTILKKQNKYSQARVMGGTSGFFCLLHPDPQQSYNQSVMRYLRGWKAREELNKGRLGSVLKQF